jgi:hypothetical protein
LEFEPYRSALSNPIRETGRPSVFTRRIFDGVLITVLAAHLAFGLPRMWARKEVASGKSKIKTLGGKAILHATS